MSFNSRSRASIFSNFTFYTLLLLGLLKTLHVKTKCSPQKWLESYPKLRFLSAVCKSRSKVGPKFDNWWVNQKIFKYYFWEKHWAGKDYWVWERQRITTNRLFLSNISEDDLFQRMKRKKNIVLKNNCKL